MNTIRDRVAIVTGAGKGIGFNAVKSLLSEGVKVLATSRDITKLVEIDNANLFAFSADLLDASAFDQIVSACVTRFGGIDIVINNAGYAKKDYLVNVTANEWDLHMAINVRAPFMLVNAAMPYLLKSNGATIINMCSAMSTKVYETQGAYAAAKHALLGYTKVLAKETFDQNIRVHAISPGGVATELIQELRPDLDLSTLSTTQEIVDIMLFLLKNRNNAVIDEVGVRRYSKEPW